MFNKMNSKQIKDGAIKNAHIAVGAAIDEDKLNIDWANRGQEILAMRLLVDFVQVVGKAVTSGASSIKITSEVSASPATTDTEKGAVVQEGKNRVIIRDAKTGEPIKSADGTEVYGRLTHDGTDYTLSFFYKNATAVETAYTFADEGILDFQFPQRFDLSSVSETFASNEKFVDGTADVSTRLDLEQIVVDAFGGGYKLTHNGTGARPQSIIEDLTDATHGTVNTDVSASEIIDEIIAARNENVDLNARLTAMDASIGATTTNVATITAELTGARNGFGSLNERLDDVDNSIADANDAITTLTTDVASNKAAITDLEAVSHKHYAEDYQVIAGDALIGTGVYTIASGETFVVGNKSLNVYYNGALQMVGVHYTEVTVDGVVGTGISFAPETFVEGDVIQLRWSK